MQGMALSAEATADTDDDILIGSELARRPARTPDFAAENEALHTLARLLIDDPGVLPKQLAEIALELCRAGSAGVSLLEETPQGVVFRWTALAGQLARYEGGSTPRHYSPCGLCLDRGEPILVAYPSRRFEYFNDIPVPIVEGLILPLFGVGKRPLGTLWIAAHGQDRRFDREDLRLMTRLADFTALAIECGAAQARVKENERRSRELLDALPAAVYTTDATGRITYFNQAAADLAGREPQLGRDKWCVTWRLHRPDGTPMPHEECPMAVALKENRPVRGEEAIAERPDGARISFVPYPTPLRDSSGALAGAVNMFVDITERKNVEQALRASEERLRAIFNSTAVGAAILTPAARFIQVNDAFCATTGYSAEELRSLDCGALTHPDDRAKMAELIEALLAGRIPSFVIEERYIRKDGGIIWVQNSVSLTRDSAGQPLHLVALCQDITERQQAEERVRASEQRLATELAAMRRLQETSTLLIQEGDADALYGQILGAAVAIMGSDMASMQMLDPERNSLRLLASKGFDPVSAAVWEWVSADSYSSCAAALRSGHRVVVPDIARCDFLLGTPGFDAYHQAGIRAMQSTPLLSRSGRVLGMISTHWSKPHQPSEQDLRLIDLLARQAADLIERTQAETALRDLNESLERRIEERTQELESAMAERQKVEAALQQAQRLEAIGQLTGGVAHDFNNLLTVVLGQAERIMATTTDEPTRRRIAAIQHAAERGARLNSQLLAFSRNQELRPQRVVIERLMTNIDDLVRRAVGETIDVTFSADPDLWPTLVDPSQFEAALLNLVINARDAMPAGGRVTVNARNAAVLGVAAIRVDLVPGDYVVVSVTDTGTGMPPHVREHAFEPFFTTKDVGKGTGLGLAQIYGFVKQSGGAADIETGVGTGTTVSLYLPRAEVETGEEVASDATSPIEGSGKTVLVVEDQPEVREVIESALNGLGYEVLTASDGAEARAMLENDAEIDLLLTDVVMPNGISGVDLAMEARRLRQDLKVVLVSGYPRGAQSRAGSGREEFVFLEKPFRQAELGDVIATALNGGNRA